MLISIKINCDIKSGEYVHGGYQRMHADKSKHSSPTCAMIAMDNKDVVKVEFLGFFLKT